ncbi:hypothetical protein PGTDC60_1952 [Porphyromonas gingivalis TDC60]|nr:hypothetical protein PGTDC60_1952 [Porphyromonas gingivalis TDC60]
MSNSRTFESYLLPFSLIWNEPTPHLITAISPFFRPCNPLVFPLFSSLFLASPRSFFRCFRGLIFAHDRRGNGMYLNLFAE